MLESSFYELGDVARGDGRFEASVRPRPATAGPWDPAHQHGGPVTALLARAARWASSRDDLVVARVTSELLGPVPSAGRLRVRGAVVRPGRAVELLRAELSDDEADGRVLATAQVWRVAAADGVDVASRAAPAPSGPDGVASMDVTGTPWEAGYIGALEWRFAVGSFLEPGPAAAWTRLRVALVDGEEPDGLDHLLCLADSGNGISGEVDLATHLFINPELTVHLLRAPEPGWLCLDASTAVAAGGVGLARSVLSDARGVVGHGSQSLLVRPR